MDRPAAIRLIARTYAFFAVANLALEPGWAAALAAVLFGALLFFLYARHNWARILLTAWSAIAVMNGLMAARNTPGMFARAAAGVLLLFLLWRADVRAWFSAEQRNS